MTESTQDQISAFIDGELSADETEFLLRRLGHDGGARRHLRSYLAIGAAVRGDLIADRAVDLSGSVAQALDGTEDEAHGHGEARGWLRFVKPVIGVAIAALVAVSALLVLQGPGTPEASVATVDGPPPNSEAPTYVVPNGQDPIPALVRPQIRLTNYLFSHGQYASSLGRQRINSSVLADQQAGSELAPEMDDDNSE